MLAPRGLFAAALSMSVLVSWACAPNADVDRPPEVTRVDSAGIEVVNIVTPAEAVPVFASLESGPVARIGALDGQPEDQFGAVQDVVALTGSAGVAVLDGQAGEVRLFDGAGNFVHALGSRGDGPGEFQGPISMAVLPGDTLAVYDARLHRVTRFDMGGVLGRAISLTSTRARVVAASFMSDGRVVTQSAWIPPGTSELPGPDPTFVRDTAVIARFSPDGTSLDTVDVVPGRETITAIQQRGQSIAVLRRPAAFGRANVFAAGPDGVWSSENDRFEMRLHHPESGDIVRIVRAPELERPIGQGQPEAILDRALSEAVEPADRRRVELWFELSPTPVIQPAFDMMEVDHLGRVWVREWSGLGESGRWWVFSAAGDLLGSVDVPVGFTIHSVECGLVWGVERDALDVSYVVGYPMSGSDDC